MKTNIISKLNTVTPLGNLALRLTLAVTIWPHGAQKVLGWFGGYGFSATYEGFTQGMNIWGPLALAAILTEFLAPFFLIAGFMTRIWAIGLTILMLVAMQVHTANGFFVNWSGQQNGEGIEYHILFAGAALALALMGPGKISLDQLILRKVSEK